MNNIIREIWEKEKSDFNQKVANLTQSWEWGEFRETTGVKVLRFGEFQDEKILSAWQIFFHKIPHTHFTVGYLPRTTLPNEEVINYLKKIGRDNNCIFIRLEPDLPYNLQPPKPHQNYLTGKPVLPVHTLFLDLTQPEEVLLKGMREKTRYNIRLAKKHQISVAEKDDEKSIEIFIKFLVETEKRQGFYSHPPIYFQKQWRALKPNPLVHLLLAYDGQTPVSGIWLVHFKDYLYYLYGGSSEKSREKMPNYLLHWEAIKLGKKLGCKTYDLWGSYKDKPEPSDPWFGIYRFKSGFGGKEVTYVGAYDLVINPSLYKLYNLADFLRWKLLKIKWR